MCVYGTTVTLALLIVMLMFIVVPELLNKLVKLVATVSADKADTFGFGYTCQPTSAEGGHNPLIRGCPAAFMRLKVGAYFSPSPHYLRLPPPLLPLLVE